MVLNEGISVFNSIRSIMAKKKVFELKEGKDGRN